MFPAFRDRFWGSQGEEGPAAAPPAAPLALDGPASPPAAARGVGSRMSNLRALDLRTLPREDGPPTELRARKDKLAFFERQCSMVWRDALFLGAEAVARNREALRDAGITHVVNCVGFLYPPYWEGELAYKTLYLQDTPGEDLLCVLYDVFDFIEAALEGGGRVLVHCSQGVSRSASLAIAYTMWREGVGYDPAFAAVKACRGVTNPNIGFICQLLQWHKRRTGAPERARLYRLSPQSSSAPQYLVPRAVSGPAAAACLDPRGAFLLQTCEAVYAWRGAHCPEAFLTAAQRFAGQLVNYEGLPQAVVLRQGEEPEAFWQALAGIGDSCSPCRSGSGAECSSRSEGSDGGGAVRENAAYDADYEIYAKAAAVAAAAAAPSDGADSARSAGKKTPREGQEGGDGASPNDRQRKQARPLAAAGAAASEAASATAADPAAAAARPSGGPALGRPKAPRARDVATSDLERGISMDSASAALRSQQRSLRRTLAASASLERAVSDRVEKQLPLSARGSRDSGATPRGRGADEEPAAVPCPAPRGRPAGVPPINLRPKRAP